VYYDILNLFKFFTVFQIFLVSIFLLSHSQRASKKNLLLVTFIMSKALFVGDTLLITFHDRLSLWMLNFVCLGSWFQLLLGPAMYFIMTATTNSNFRFKPVHSLHLVPFLLHLGFVVSQYHVLPVEAKMQLLQNWYPWSASWSKLSALGIYSHFTIYGLIALSVLSKAKKYTYSFNSQSVERNIFYLKFLIYDFIVVWGINIVSMYVPFGQIAGRILQAATVFNIFFIANAIVYQGLKFPSLFLDEPENRSKYEKNLLSEGEKEQYVKKIHEYVLNYKPYLNPTLSLSDLADQLALPPYVISQVLNMKLNQNFYNFINQFRIEESKQILSTLKESEKSILEVLYQCGFNSKSVFNSAFKRHTGMTPREFKKHTLAQHQPGRFYSAS
jgi:AraC-like DNA-binding protein